jgi:hypothetical protein
MRKILALTALAASLAMPTFAQMTSDQRLTDFQTLAALYAKRYGPANWKTEALGVNVFNMKPWADRIRAATDDLEYYQICAEFVASLQDGHSSFRVPSNFFADLGLFTDIYDGKVLIESINRTRYPVARFPFVVGDELVSIGGKPVEELITELAKTRGYGTERGARRQAADSLVFRSQVFHPKAVDLPDETDVVVRRASTGETETYTLQWVKTGVPFRQVSPVPTPGFSRNPAAAANSGEVSYQQAIRDYKTWAIDPMEVEMREARQHIDDSGQMVSRNYILGWGSRIPYYNPPAGFVVRRGLAPTDNFLTGTYNAGGKRIGLIRIPNFGPANTLAAVNEFSTEVAYMKANTDGLIVDISRNTGGGCVGLDYAQRLIPRNFYFFGEYLRPTQSLINNFESFLRQAKTANAEQWVIDVWQFQLNAVQEAAKNNRSMTGALPACFPAVSQTFPAPSSDWPPLRDSANQLVAYDKPMVFLADELSVSFGDIFPAMMQDNKRGPIVGMRTGGLGGSVGLWSVGFYSEASSSVTNSLVLRNAPVTAPGLPSAPLIENIGVIPDIELDYMTRDNLINGGRPFIEAVTRIMLDEIAKAGQ